MSFGFLAAMSRRRLLGGAGTLALLPTGRARASASSIASPVAPDPLSPRLELALEIRATVGGAVPIGPGTDGFRRLVPVTGGSFSGPRLAGTVVPGGANWHLEREDGLTALEGHYTLETTDGARVTLTHRGLLAATGGAAGSVRTVPEFEVGAGPHEWLNRGVFVGSLDVSTLREGHVVVRVFRVL